MRSQQFYPLQNNNLAHTTNPNTYFQIGIGDSVLFYLVVLLPENSVS